MTSGRNTNLNSLVVGAPFLLAAISFLATQGIAAEPPEQFEVWGKNAKADKYMGDPGLDTPGKADVAATPGERERGFYNPIDGGRVPAQPPGVYDQWREKIADLAQKLK
jgi:hypothetical protein